MRLLKLSCIVSVICLVISCFSFSFSALAETLGFDDLISIEENTIFESRIRDLFGYASEQVKQKIIDKSVETAIDNNQNYIQFGNYQILTGENRLNFISDIDNSECWIYIKAVYIRSDVLANDVIIYDDKPCKVNHLYYYVDYSDGTHIDWECAGKNQNNVIQAMKNGNNVDSNGTLITRNNLGGLTVWKNGEIYDTSRTLYDFRFVSRNINSINTQIYNKIYFYADDRITHTKFPTGNDAICVFQNRLTYGISGGFGTYTTDFNLYTQFQETNIKSLNDRYITYQGNTYQQNRYYDSTYQGDSIINNENITNYFNNTVSPDLVFSPDGSLLPDLDLKPLLKPSLDLALGDLNNKITNYFSNMPDLNNEWNLPTSGNNNYWDLLPDTPGGGGGGGGGDITVNIDFPEYPQHTTTYIISAQNITNTTVDYINAELDENIIKDSQKIVKHGFDFWRLSGLLPVIIAIAVFGLFWRFTGE